MVTSVCDVNVAGKDSCPLHCSSTSHTFPWRRFVRERQEAAEEERDGGKDQASFLSRMKGALVDAEMNAAANKVHLPKRSCVPLQALASIVNGIQNVRVHSSLRINLKGPFFPSSFVLTAPCYDKPLDTNDDSHRLCRPRRRRLKRAQNFRNDSGRRMKQRERLRRSHNRRKPSQSRRRKRSALSEHCDRIPMVHGSMAAIEMRFCTARKIASFNVRSALSLRQLEPDPVPESGLKLHGREACGHVHFI